MNIFRSTAAILLSVLFFFSPHFAFAGAEHNIAGWAWSDNIGWISFNSTNTSGSVDYGVNENLDGTLVGYAWSSNIGWIQFGGLSGFPTGSGTTAQNAQVVGGNVIGWARAISEDNNGWDGWISLSGANYNTTLSGYSFGGYAWGSSVVGWISLSAANSVGGGCGIADCLGVAINSSATLDAQSPLGTSIANQTNVPWETAPTLVWTLTNLPGANCSVSETSGATPFNTISNITSSGSASTSGLTNGSYVFNITCTSGGNTVASSNVSFTVAPQPQAFSLGADDTLKIDFLPAGWSQSETKSTSVNAVGGFTGNVTVSISGFPTMPNASTTALYSINGGAYVSSPSVTVPYNGSFTFRVEVSAPLTSAYCSGSPNPCTITLQGISGSLSATKRFIITPTAFNPQFHEF